MEILSGSGLRDQVDRDAKFGKKCDQPSLGYVEVEVHA